MILKPNIFTRTCRKRRAEKGGPRGAILGSFTRPRPTKVVEIDKPRIRNRYQMVKYRKDHPVCEECCARKATCTHHIIPFCEGGEDIPSNYMALCNECHNKKHPEITNNPCFWKNEYNQCITRQGKQAFVL